MARHTKGPWYKSNGYGIQACVYGGDPGVLVADCQAEGTPVPEQAANARLIAEAPNLLAALESAGEQWQQHNLNSTATEELRSAFIDRITIWWNEVAVPAIRKAEGESN